MNQTTTGHDSLYQRVQLLQILQTAFAKSLGPEIGQTPSGLFEQEIGK